MNYDPDLLGHTTGYSPVEHRFSFRRMRRRPGRYRYYLGMNVTHLRHFGVKRLQRKRVWEWV